MRGSKEGVVSSSPAMPDLGKRRNGHKTLTYKSHVLGTKQRVRPLFSHRVNWVRGRGGNGWARTWGIWGLQRKKKLLGIVPTTST